jgi:hypothetical protein
MHGGFFHSWAYAAAFALAFSGCGKPENEPQSENKAVPGAIGLPVDSDKGNAGDTLPTEPQVAEVVAETLSSEPTLKRVRHRLRIDTIAFVGHPWILDLKAAYGASFGGGQVEIEAGPVGMQRVGDSLRFVPVEPGRHEVRLHRPGNTAEGNSATSLVFSLQAVKPIQLKVAGPDTAVMTGEKANFFLSHTLHPFAEAALSKPARVGDRPGAKTDPTVTWTLRIDGDAPAETTWSVERDVASESRVPLVFTRAGDFNVAAVVYWKGVAADSAVMRVSVLAPVGATLTGPADTLEPGAKAVFVISELKGVAPFQLALDTDGDGNSDWKAEKGAQGAQGGASEGKNLGGGRVQVAMPRSGTFTARLMVTDSKGLKGQSEARVVVNSKLKVKALAKSSRVNQATPFQLKLDYADSDDSVVRVFALLPDTALGSNRIDTVAPEGVKWSRQWKRSGFYPAKLCAVSVDRRHACAEIRLEVFNAKPVCKIVTDLKPVPGVPVTLRGEAQDPDGALSRFEWDLDADGRFEWQRSENLGVPFTFARKGKFPVRFQVTSADGMVARDSAVLEVKNAW